MLFFALLQKCLAGMSAGAWLVGAPFVDACVEAGGMADPAPHELTAGMPGRGRAACWAAGVVARSARNAGSRNGGVWTATSQAENDS